MTPSQVSAAIRQRETYNATVRSNHAQAVCMKARQKDSNVLKTGNKSVVYLEDIVCNR